MKRPLIIGTILVLSTLLIYACNSTIRTASTSFVTIKIGDGPGAGTLHAEQATFWTRVKYLASDISLLPRAYAYIPPSVKVLVVTVSAPDMTTIVAVDNVANKSSASIRIEVPNGSARQFQVEGLDASSTVTYRGTARADLNGAEVTLPITMLYAGAGIYVNASMGSDAAGCGAQAAPCRTITFALSQSAGNEAIVVEAGTYDSVLGETFPLQLKAGTKLICSGPNLSTVIDSGVDGIYGNAAASVENCSIFVCDSTGIDDLGSPMTINHVLLDASPSCGGGAGNGIVLAADSTVSDVTVRDPFSSAITVNAGNPVIANSTLVVTGTVSVFPFYGIDVVGGNPTITGTMINGFFGDGVGDGVLISAGSATVTQCSFSGNGRGIEVAGGNAAITGNTVSGSSTGIEVSNGSIATITGNAITGSSSYGIYLWGSVAAPTATISGNTIRQNTRGIYAQSVGASSIHNNTISCNSAVDLYLADAGAGSYDITGNAWDHDASTLVTGPTITNDLAGCPAGVDICYINTLSLPPVYQPFNAAVPGGCQ